MKTELELMKQFIENIEREAECDFKDRESAALNEVSFHAGIVNANDYILNHWTFKAMKEMVESANTPLNRDRYHYGFMDGKEAGRKEVVNEYNSVDELKEKMDRPTLVDYFFKEQEVCGAQEYERIYKISDYIEKYLK